MFENSPISYHCNIVQLMCPIKITTVTLQVAQVSCLISLTASMSVNLYWDILSIDLVTIDFILHLHVFSSQRNLHKMLQWCTSTIMLGCYLSYCTFIDLCESMSVN